MTVLVDDLDKLEYYTPLGFINTFTSGWMTKINLLVRHKSTHVPGYMITSIDFEDNLSGLVRCKGAKLTQRIPSHRCNYVVDKETTSLSLLYHCTEDNAGLSFTNATLSEPNQMDAAFVSFVTSRYVKVLYQTDKQVESASERGPGDSFTLDGVQSLLEVEVDTNIAWKRLGLFLKDPTWKLCQDMTCFIQPSYTLVDHKNEKEGVYQY